MKTVLACIVLTTSLAYSAWTPPANPDPDVILNEAVSDTRGRRYEDALAKHVWYHENALKYNPAHTGVRLSFALGYWDSLGQAYPPALEKLKSIRDETEKKVRSDDGRFEDFMDVSGINRTLQEERKTKDLFLWLDANKPGLARKCYRVATPALLDAKEYKVCGKYLDPDRTLRTETEMFRMNMEMEKRGKHGDRMKQHAENSFSEHMSILVALLVLNDRKAEADRIATEALKAWDNAGFKEEMEKARKGELPNALY